MRFNIVESTQGNTGYAKATRELANAMSKKIDVVYGQAPKKDDYTYGRLYFQQLQHFYGTNLIGNLVLESTCLPERAVREANQDFTKQVWCPSTFCRNNYVNSGIIEEKIKIIPHGVNTDIYHPTRRDSGTFMFLFVGGYTGKGDRKGADMLVKAFTEEFKKDDVKLYLKINPSYGHPEAVEELSRMSNDKVTINTMDVTEKEMNDIYNLGDCFVSPSHAEGFNMTCLEAMACGLPVITTDCGGQLDYLPEDNVIITPESTIPARYSPWDCGRWVRPHLPDLKMNMRWVFDNQDEIRKIGRKNSCVAKKWSWLKSSQKAIQALKSI